MKYIPLQPSAYCLIESLRDIGYSMETAVADVIDNSITAKASLIRLNFSWNDANPWFSISDDGCGMSSEELLNAMRLGSRHPHEAREKQDLGRFGLGLKTASFSQCRQLTVISKKNGSTSAYEWDLEWIRNNPQSNWDIRVLSNKEISGSELINSLEISSLSGGSGTIVIWRKMDRHDKSESKLDSLVLQSRRHLELVFHRYISPGIGQKGLNIYLNNDKLVAFNPFNPTNNATQELPSQVIHLNDSTIHIQPYVLPHYNKVDRDEYKKYGGLEGYLQNQGFYIYRNKRLIIKGTWFRLIKKEELTKLLRVQVDIPNSLDDLWKIDVKKSHASPPEIIKKGLRSIIERISNSGKRVYQQRGIKLSNSVKDPAWIREQKEGSINYCINKEHPFISDLENSLSYEQKTKLNDILFTLESGFPKEIFYSDLASNPESLKPSKIETNLLSDSLDTMISILKNNDVNKNDMAERILNCDPFVSQQRETKELLINKGLINE